MPGLYSISTRAPGTLITALIYNNDHQVHVDGREAEFMQSYSISVAQMNITEDPLPSGVESLPIALSGELSRLRFEIAALKTGLSGDTPVNWYDAIGQAAFAIVGARIQRPTSLAIASGGGGTVISFTAGGTADFNSGVWSTSNPTRFTAPIAGKYYVCCGVKWQATSGTGRKQLTARINGATTDAMVSNTTNALATEQWQSIGSLMNLAASDYVEFLAFQDSGVSVTLLVDEAVSVVGGMIFFGVNP